MRPNRFFPMVGPPWWIIHGVKPSGPPKNMGSWTAISFSAEQQVEFGVNEDGEVLDKAKFDSAIQARRGAAPEPATIETLETAVLIPEKLYKIAVKGTSRGLHGGSSMHTPLGMVEPAVCQWRICHGPPGWFCIAAAGASPMHLDLSNPGQQPNLAAPADVSGQYWKLESVIGCKEFEGGATARCVIGYKLHSMWTGTSKLLTGDDVARLQDDEALPEQVWEILEESGEMWTETSQQAAEREPELAVCDFGLQQEPELAVCDFGRPAP